MRSITTGHPRSRGDVAPALAQRFRETLARSCRDYIPKLHCAYPIFLLATLDFALSAPALFTAVTAKYQVPAARLSTL